MPGRFLRGTSPSRETRAAAKVNDALREVSIVTELEVPGNNISNSFHLGRPTPVENTLLPREHAAWYAGVMFVMIGNVVAIVGAVGDVTIDKEVRVPLVPEAQPGACLGRVCFHVVAIQVQIR